MLAKEGRYSRAAAHPQVGACRCSSPDDRQVIDESGRQTASRQADPCAGLTSPVASPGSKQGAMSPIDLNRDNPVRRTPPISFVGGFSAPGARADHSDACRSAATDVWAGALRPVDVPNRD